MGGTINIAHLLEGQCLDYSKMGGTLNIAHLLEGQCLDYSKMGGTINIAHLLEDAVGVEQRSCLDWMDGKQ